MTDRRSGAAQSLDKGNLFENVAPAADAELFTELLHRPGLRVERIVSMGQTTPVDQPYDQPQDEWVALLSGGARLWVEGEGEIALRPGDHLMIPARRKHRVVWTAPDEPSVWLALHVDPA